MLGEGPRIHPDRPGTAIEILRLIARQHRLSLDIRRYPWKRTLHMLANSEIDLLVYASFTPERAAIGEYPMLGGVPDPSRRFATLRYMTYRRKGEPVYALPGTISGTPGPVGVPGGYSVAALLRARGIRVDESQSTEVDLRKLAAGRVQAVVALEETAEAIIGRDPALGTAIESAGVIDTRHYFFVFSKKYRKTRPEMADAVWTSLARYRESPAFRAIEESYRGTTAE